MESKSIEIIIEILGLVGFFILTSKWILFIFLAPLINRRIKSTGIRRHKRSISGETENNIPKRSVIFSLCKKSIHYLDGYIRYMDIMTGRIPSHHIRKFIYKTVFRVSISSKVIIFYGAEIRNHARLVIKKGAIVGDNSILDARNGIEIGENACLASDVQIWTQ